jgi:hypothetical protein
VSACIICGATDECCEHDLAYLESVAKLQVNHERWREETRAEQARQLEQSGAHVKRIYRMPARKQRP